MSETLDERVRAMRLRRGEGATYAQIGKEFGLSRQRVHQLITGVRVTTTPTIRATNAAALEELRTTNELLREILAILRSHTTER